jgi:hypothetical protein
MSEPKVFKARYGKHGAGEIEGLTHVVTYEEATEVQDPGGTGATGRAASGVTHIRKWVEYHGTNAFALLALIDDLEANAVFGYLNDAETKSKRTIKNVRFVKPIPPLEISAVDAGGVLPTMGVRGLALGGTTDVPSTMEVDSSDT